MAETIPASLDIPEIPHHRPDLRSVEQLPLLQSQNQNKGHPLPCWGYPSGHPYPCLGLSQIQWIKIEYLFFPVIFVINFTITIKL